MTEPTILFQSPGITIAFDPVAHTLAPYFGSNRPDGTNHGFFDLRDRPDLVDSIPEVQENPFLRNVLVALNRKGSRFMSIGCERGPIRQTGQSDWPFAVCAYTTVAFRDLPSNRSKEDHVRLAHSIWEKFEPQSRIMPVLLELTIEPLKLLWDINDAFALDLKMIANGRTEQEAMTVLSRLGPAVADVIEELA
jgi:hypothetical protein